MGGALARARWARVGGLKDESRTDTRRVELVDDWGQRWCGVYTNSTPLRRARRDVAVAVNELGIIA